MDGVPSDETREFPAGTYIRNPPGTAHAPHTTTGCTLFVKLHQFAPEDGQRVVVDTRSATFAPGLVRGLSVLPLHAFGTEHVALVRWAPGTRFNPHRHWGGEEILVLDGVFEYEHPQLVADVRPACAVTADATSADSETRHPPARTASPTEAANGRLALNGCGACNMPDPSSGPATMKTTCRR